MWMLEYHFDGTRIDSTVNVRKNDGHDLPGGWAVMQDWNKFVDHDEPGGITIAEDLQNEEWINKPVSEGGAGYDSQWFEDLFWSLHDAVVQADDSARDIGRIVGAMQHYYLGEATHRVMYTENHDKVPSDRQLRLPRAISPNSPDDYWARKRSTLAAGVLLTTPGIPMLFEGQECLETLGFDFPTPGLIDWTRCDRFSGIHDMYRDLVRLRRNLDGTSRGLTGNSLNVFHVNNKDKVLAYHRWDAGGPGDDVVVVANFSNTAFPAYDIGFPRGGTWKVRFNGDWVGYDAEFKNTPSDAVEANQGTKDGLSYRGTVGIGPYTVIVLSQ
jgi:1,4-alpha-glucan branching enzyme